MESITVQLTSCLTDFGFRCLVNVELETYLLVWSNPNGSNGFRCFVKIELELFYQIQSSQTGGQLYSDTSLKKYVSSLWTLQTLVNERMNATLTGKANYQSQLLVKI